MKKVKIIIFALLALISILVPVVLPVIVAGSIASQYENTFVGALDEKVQRLDSIEGEKAIVIGGSSVAFGIDSELLEEHLEIPVVNFGLYAAIGTVAMMELSRMSIGEGDLIILSPEPDSQTFSTYFGTDMILKAIDSDYSLITRFSEDQQMRLISSMWDHSVEKILDSFGENKDPQGIYNSKNFNERGDIIPGLRSENVMPLYYDPNTPIDLGAALLTDEFADYVNEYVSYCESKGARVVFAYAPMNELALTDSAKNGGVYEFERALAQGLDCEVVGFVDTYVMDAGYFYDTNYHLNDAGVIYRTRRLIEDLKGVALESGPAAPPLASVNVKYDGEDDPNANLYVYEKMSNGAYKIVGLTERGKEASELIVPLGVDGIRVMGIDSRAFADGVATRLIVTADTNLRNFLDGCLDGSAITDVWIYYDYTDEDEKLAPASSFGGVTIHFPPGSAYSTSYDWQDSSGGYVPREDAILP